jgi:hypothetical protein
MNKRGSIFLGFSISIFLFIMGVLIMPYLFDDIATARVGLNCDSEDITSGNMLSCLFISATNPYFIWLFTSLALGLIIGGLR